MIAPKTRKEAAQIGAKFFFTGRACKNGHTANRYRASGNCVVCAQAGQREFATVSKADAGHARTAHAQGLHPARYNLAPRHFEHMNALAMALALEDGLPMPTLPAAPGAEEVAHVAVFKAAERLAVWDLLCRVHGRAHAVARFGANGWPVPENAPDVAQVQPETRNAWPDHDPS